MQSAKGFPGRRRSKVERQLAEAEARARAIATAPPAADPVAPPAFLDRPELAGALAIWRDLAPRLDRLNLVEPTDRYALALACSYFDEWLVASADVARMGGTVMVKTTVGGRMPRLNPSVHVREIAYRNFTALAEKFGLTPLDRYNLIARQAGIRGVNPGAQPGAPDPGAAIPHQAPPPPAADPDQPELLGFLARLDQANRLQ